MDFPKMYPIRQEFETTSISDVAAAVRVQMEALALTERVRPGQTVG